MELNEESVGKLANCVIFALKHMKTAHGGMMYRTFPDGTCKMLSWEDDFIEALKGVGVEIDREKLNAVRNPPKRKK